MMKPLILFLIALGTSSALNVYPQSPQSHSYAPIDQATTITALYTFSAGLSAPFGTITTLHGTSDTTLAFASAPNPCSLSTQAANGVDIHGNATGCFTPATGTFPQTIANASHQWLNSYSASTGLFTQSQPALSDLTAIFTLPLSLSVNTLNCAVASGSQAGCLASSDWTAFNNKQPAGSYALQSTVLTASSPLTGGGDLSTGRSFGCQVASGSQAGCLASADWTAFNSKQASISSDAGISHQFVYGFTAPNTFLKKQPACADLSDSVSTCNTFPTFVQITSTPTTLSGYGITNGVANTVTVNGHALSSNVTVSASDLTTGTLPTAQLPTDSRWQSLTVNIAAAAITGVVTTNGGKFWSIYIDGLPKKVSTIAFYASAIDNSSNTYDFGLFGPGCLNSATSIPLAAHTGAFAGSSLPTPGSAGIKAVALSGAPVTLANGYYCVGLTSSAATPLITLGGDNTVAYNMPFSTNAAIASVSSSGTFNSTITAPTLAQGLTKMGSVWLY